MSIRILTGDCREVLATLPEKSIQCCVTSPPYYGLRDYGVVGQIGLEPTPDEYVAEMVAVFRDVRRVLRDDGVLWLNLGDSYNNFRSQMGPGQAVHGRDDLRGKRAPTAGKRGNVGFKEKDLLGIPWMIAFAMRADGWYLRSAVVWHKPNPMPESVTDRPTSAYEMVFLLSKNAQYFYDADAIAEQAQDWSKGGPGTGIAPTHHYSAKNGGNGGLSEIAARYKGGDSPTTRNARNVWTIATQPFPGSHFATMPPDLAERCILAGSGKGDTILDPFGGAGTTALVADRLGRNATIIELNPEYAAMARERISQDAGMFADVA